MTSIDSYYPAVLAVATLDGDVIHRGSGVLLAGGRYILTAAHLVAGDSAAADVSLSNLDQLGLPAVSNIFVHPGWDPATYNNDIAILELAQPVTAIEGLDLYRGGALLGQEFVRVGYGDGPDVAQHIGTNIYDAPGEVLNGPYGRDVPDGSQLLYDFDNGADAQNMLDHFVGYSSDAQMTVAETLARAGDSGGPALINGQVAGIASYVVADPGYDGDSVVASSAGEAGADTHVASYLGWIDDVTGVANVELPVIPGEAVDLVDVIESPEAGGFESTCLETADASMMFACFRDDGWGLGGDVSGLGNTSASIFSVLQGQPVDAMVMPFFTEQEQPRLDAGVELIVQSLWPDMECMAG